MSFKRSMESMNQKFLPKTDIYVILSGIRFFTLFKITIFDFIS